MINWRVICDGANPCLGVPAPADSYLAIFALTDFAIFSVEKSVTKPANNVSLGNMFSKHKPMRFWTFLLTICSGVDFPMFKGQIANVLAGNGSGVMLQQWFLLSNYRWGEAVTTWQRPCILSFLYELSLSQLFSMELQEFIVRPERSWYLSPVAARHHISF